MSRVTNAKNSDASRREKAKLCLGMLTESPHTCCHHPRMRVIQYAAASRLKHCRLSNTGLDRPVKPGDDEWNG
jgi:hypothetical protein